VGSCMGKESRGARPWARGRWGARRFSGSAGGEGGAPRVAGALGASGGASAQAPTNPPPLPEEPLPASWARAFRGKRFRDSYAQVLDGVRREGMLPLARERLGHARTRLDRVLDRLATRDKNELAPPIERVWDDGIAALRARARDPASREAEVTLDCGLTLRGLIDLVEASPSGALLATDYKTARARVVPGVTLVDGGRLLQPVLYALALEKLFPRANVDGGRLYYCTSAGGFEDVRIPLTDEARRAAGVVAEVIGKALDEEFFARGPRQGCVLVRRLPGGVRALRGDADGAEKPRPARGPAGAQETEVGWVWERR